VPPVNRSTGWPCHCASFHRPESSETGFAPRPESGGFAPAPCPASLPLRTAKPPHSCRPRFEPVPQPESRSIPLTRPFAPATMLGLAAFALRVWASSNGRPLHSAAFRLRDKGSRPRAPFGDVFKSLVCQRSQPLALHEPACAQGAGRGDLPRNPSTGRPVPQAFFVKGERPRTHSSKKKDYENTYNFRFKAPEPDRTAHWEQTAKN
jgi:hypothetical protein